ncbi:MAG: hypothetical protein HZC12_06630 [Nitrospirae bacterium]|nr:hypothetical protein [Nitrospirota bacterium]
MRMKRILILLMAFVFTFSIAGLSFSKESAEIKGMVTKVEGNMLIIVDDMGKETAVEVKDAKDIKVGNRVVVKNGAVTKEPAESPGSSRN